MQELPKCQTRKLSPARSYPVVKATLPCFVWKPPGARPVAGLKRRYNTLLPTFAPPFLLAPLEAERRLLDLQLVSAQDKQGAYERLRWRKERRVGSSRHLRVSIGGDSTVRGDLWDLTCFLPFGKHRAKRKKEEKGEKQVVAGIKEWWGLIQRWLIGTENTSFFLLHVLKVRGRKKQEGTFIMCQFCTRHSAHTFNVPSFKLHGNCSRLFNPPHSV